MEELVQFLRSLAFCSDGAVNYLKAVAVARTFQNREQLLKQGRVNNRIYFLESGVVRCYYDDEGRQVTSWLMGPGDLAISPSSFFTGLPSRESLQSIGETRTISISRHELDFLYEKFPEFERIGRKLGEKYQLWTEERLYVLHMRSAKEKYEYFFNNKREFIAAVPDQYIASLLHITPSHLSTIKGQRLL